MQLKRFGFAAAVVAATVCLPLRAAVPTVGQPAPALTFTELLQAPAGAKTDWPSLRGKVVVLEFWATWCGGCIEEIPHLNDLQKSLASTPEGARIQFIAVDDEDPAMVKKFLAKMPIGGWLVFDASKKTIDAYDAQVRPRTFVVDPQGNIAGVMAPQQLTGEQVIALADGKPVAFPKDEMTDARQQALKAADATKALAEADPAGTTAPKALFDISILPGDPDGKTTIAHRTGKDDDSYTFDMQNAPLSLLFTYAAGIQSTRLTIHGDPKIKYSLHVSAPGGEIKDLAPALQLAIVTAANMKLTRVTAEEDAYILQTTPKAASLLPPATSEQGSMCFYSAKAGKLVMMRSQLDSLAQQLETLLGTPVLNETGLAGDFDANFDLPKGDAEGARASLEKNLGLTLTKARRKIERFVLDAPKPAEDATEKPAQ